MTLRRRKYLARFRAAGGENPKEIETRRKLPPWLPARCFLVLFPVNLGWGSCRPFWPQPAAVSSVRGQRWAFVWCPRRREQRRRGGPFRGGPACPVHPERPAPFCCLPAAAGVLRTDFPLPWLFYPPSQNKSFLPRVWGLRFQIWWIHNLPTAGLVPGSMLITLAQIPQVPAFGCAQPSFVLFLMAYLGLQRDLWISCHID